MAGNLLMSISQDEVERARFRSRRKFQTDYQSDIATAEDRGEKRKALSMAQLMIADGESDDKIMRYTGLSPDDLEKLKS